MFTINYNDVQRFAESLINVEQDVDGGNIVEIYQNGERTAIRVKATDQNGEHPTLVIYNSTEIGEDDE